jgi:hypothetical protein
MEQEATALALFLALVLGSAAAHKLVSRHRLAGATAKLLRLPLAVAEPLMFGAAAAEAMAAVALAIPAARLAGAAIAASLWALYAIALFAAHRRGEADLDCGCSFFPAPKAARAGPDAFTLVRPLGLALVAIVVAITPALSLGVVSVFAAAALFAFYLAAGEIAALPTPARSLFR